LIVRLEGDRSALTENRRLLLTPWTRLFRVRD